MQNKQIAIIDIGSSKITALVGENGINDTFLIKYNSQYDYDGFSSGEFFDKDAFIEQLKIIAKDLVNFYQGKLSKVFVGVPGDFTSVVCKESQVSFSKKRKITEKEINYLFDSAFSLNSTSYSLINRSSIYYELDDFRRVANPLNCTSEILKAKLSYIICKNYFIEIVEPVLIKSGIKEVEFVSSPLAEALYLIDADSRDRFAVLLDVGYISTTLSIIQGDGIIYLKSFDFGGGYITANIVEKYSISFEDAENLKRKINLSSINKNNNYNIIEGEYSAFYNEDEIKSVIYKSLDTLCENILDSFNEFNLNIPEYVPLMITGGGISFLRGAKEHVAGRLNMSVSVVSPKVPLMQKPNNSSVLSLLNLAILQD